MNAILPIMVNDRQVVVRVPADTVDRAERVASILTRRPEYAGMRVTWTTVLRLAMLRGLDGLEAEARPGRRS
jgi:hypothetical protein